MIGKICWSTTPFYDRKIQQNSFKKRPVLIISSLHSNDYTVLPVSTISDPINRDPKYDIEVKKSNYPLLNLNKDSFIRTHKQTTVHKAEITSTISDLSKTYNDLYLDVLTTLEDYNKEIMDNAL